MEERLKVVAAHKLLAMAIGAAIAACVKTVIVRESTPAPEAATGEDRIARGSVDRLQRAAATG